MVDKAYIEHEIMRRSKYRDALDYVDSIVVSDIPSGSLSRVIVDFRADTYPSLFLDVAFTITSALDPDTYVTLRWSALPRGDVTEYAESLEVWLDGAAAMMHVNN